MLPFYSNNLQMNMGTIRSFLPVLLLSTVLTVTAKPRTIFVNKGSAESLLEAIDQANKLNADSTAERLFIILPDGIYDLGQRVLTTITGHNIAIVGQSMTGTIIKNAPDIKNEGISKTGTLRNMATGLYLQDLTLQDALDYYNAGAAGRAVCLHDKGTRTICNRVRMLSYQDTYYSDNEEAQHYFADSEIHGTVDFICGAGDVFFNRCTIATEKRTADGSGRNVIAAPRTSKTPWGYVFNACTIRCDISQFHYARGWHTTPKCVWIGTTLQQPELLRESRYDTQGMRTVESTFGEYGTVDAQGNSICPASNVITLVCKDQSKTIETILTPSQVKRYTLDNVFPDWNPDAVMRKLQKKAQRLRRKALEVFR